MSQPRGSLRSRQPHPNAEKWSHFSAFVMWGSVIGILLVGFALRLHGLENKGFWGDEIFQVRQSLRPLTALVTRGQTPEIYDDFVLHFLVLHFVGELGHDEFWLRAPSVAYSVLAMAATSLIGARLFGRGAGLVALALMAVAPFQIWYAQETRMYAAHTFFSALSFYFFLRLLRRPERGALAGLVLANTLGLYNHLFMVFPLMVEGIVGVGLVLKALPNRARDRRGQVIVGGLAGTLILCVPLFLGFLPYLALQVSDTTADPLTVVRKIDLPFLQDLLLYLSIGADWSWRVLVSVTLALLGGFWLVRRDRKMIWIVLVFVLPLVTLYAVTPAGNIAHRYLIFMQPLFLTLIAGGVWLVGLVVVQGMARGDAARARWSAPMAVAAGLALLGIVVIPPLTALYSRAKLNDWRAVTNYLRANAAANDRVSIERAPWGERAFRWYAPETRARFATLADLENARLGSRPVWYISFGGFFDAASDAWAQDHLVPVADSEWQQPGLIYTTTDVYKFPQSESPTVIYKSDW